MEATLHSSIKITKLEFQYIYFMYNLPIINFFCLTKYQIQLYRQRKTGFMASKNLAHGE